MIALFASFFSLCVGPLIYQTFGPLRRTDKIVNGIILIVVGGTIVFETLPESYQHIGLFAFLLGLVGFAGPTLVERTFHKAADTTHKLTILLGILGLIIHAFIDGMAIQSAENNSNSNGLTLAIILHRLPVGLTIWWLLKPLLGERYALVTLLVMGVSTFIGYAFSTQVIISQEHNFFPALQALIAGSLLHVVIHKPHSDGCMHTSEAHHKHQQQKTTINDLKSYFFRWEGLGLLIGMIILSTTHWLEL